MKKYQYIIDKIRELYKEKDAYIPLHAPIFLGNEKQYLEDCIDSTFVSSVGKYVDDFEEKMAHYTGATHAVSCVNGTNALHIALQLVGVIREDEVLTQALTFVATTNAIIYCGAYPVFLDVDIDTAGLSPKALKEFLKQNAKIVNGQCYNKSTGRRIKACVPMHTFGHPCRIDEIIAICNEYNILLVEDAAESIGSRYKGKHTGTFGNIGVLSFNGNKTITTGGGGMLLFNDAQLATKAKHLTTQAKVPHQWEFVHDEIGYNYRMPSINAALGLAQLEKINFIIKRKREIAQEYEKIFQKIGIEFFTEPPNAYSSYWLNAILLPDKKSRDVFLMESNEGGIMTRPVWQLMSKLAMYKDCQNDGLKNSLFLQDKLVNIPSSVIKI